MAKTHINARPPAVNQYLRQMVLTAHYGNFILTTITSLKVKVRFGKQHPYLISHTVASVLKMEVAACLL